MGAAGDSFLSGSAALWGRKLLAKYTQKSSQSHFVQRVRIEMGAAKLKKQEEACEILSSGAGCQSVGGLVCSSSGTAATGSQQLGAQDPQLCLRV